MMGFSFACFTGVEHYGINKKGAILWPASVKHLPPPILTDVYLTIPDTHFPSATDKHFSVFLFQC